MINFFREQFGAGGAAAPFGHLEEAVMDVLWAQGESSVHEVMARLERALAYTTVMTTLDRLYKKGLLERRKESRAFVYSPRSSRAEWERERAYGLIAGFLEARGDGGELLLSSFLDAVGEHDEALLLELEKRIKEHRRKILRRNGR